jgi:hypothetical protein
MSSSNTFTNDLMQTSISDAYKYSTFSPYINNMKSPTYSPVCIFCSCKETVSLMNDGGSFRSCSGCKKQFKAVILHHR